MTHWSDDYWSGPKGLSLDLDMRIPRHVFIAFTSIGWKQALAIVRESRANNTPHSSLRVIGVGKIVKFTNVG
jgi:hypothetical protein